MNPAAHGGEASRGTTRSFVARRSRPLPSEVLADLRTDHAGETGAVCIYLGVLQVTRDPALRRFAERHLATERSHLRCIESWLPTSSRSRLLPLWRVSGWLTGALPALLGPRAVYATIEAVERFVDRHYGEQIERMHRQRTLWALRKDLERCRADEVAHRDEAGEAAGTADPGPLLRGWTRVVDLGSRVAVGVCRRI